MMRTVPLPFRVLADWWPVKSLAYHRTQKPCALNRKRPPAPAGGQRLDRKAPRGGVGHHRFEGLVRAVGIEPTLLSEPDFESGASTSSTTPASEATVRSRPEQPSRSRLYRPEAQPVKNILHPGSRLIAERAPVWRWQSRARDRPPRHGRRLRPAARAC